MNDINDFVKIRQDGKEVPEGMTSAQFGLVNNEIAKIVGAKWKNNQEDVSIIKRFPMLVQVVSGRQYVAAIESLDESQTRCFLTIYRADGSKLTTLTDVLNMDGKPVQGTWNWFEKSASIPEHHVVATFQSTWKDSVGETHYVDDFVEVDATSGKVVKVQKGK